MGSLHLNPNSNLIFNRVFQAGKQFISSIVLSKATVNNSFSKT